MKIPKLLQLLRDNARAEKQPLRVEQSANAAHIYVYDVIDQWWGASASALVDALKAVGDVPVHLHINSPGGDVFEGTAMAAAVAAHTAPVTAHIDGLAASAATRVALAAQEVRIADSALFMIHNSWTLALGDKTELRATADLLDKVDATITADYQRKTGAGADQVVAWMNAETWFTASEALAAGFVDAIDPTSQSGDGAATARWNLSAYRNAPAAALQAPADPTVTNAALLAEQAARQLQANRNRLRLLAPL